MVQNSCLVNVYHVVNIIEYLTNSHEYKVIEYMFFRTVLPWCTNDIFFRLCSYVHGRFYPTVCFIWLFCLDLQLGDAALGAWLRLHVPLSRPECLVILVGCTQCSLFLSRSFCFIFLWGFFVCLFLLVFFSDKVSLQCAAYPITHY